MNKSEKYANRRRSSASGMALIEALVALAVMAFGLLGVVGMQATLRFNADVSRQRAEAVRMAQEQMETLRSFGVLSGATSPQRDYAGIAGATDSPTPPTGFANATFTRTWTVLDPGADDLKMKSVQVEVKWRDRRTASTSADADLERVVLTSTIAQVAPELSAALGLPGDQSAAQRPRGRHASVPPGAVDQGNGTSTFAPPGAPTGTSWTFVNATGQITSLCFPAGTCTAVQGWLLSGNINFATGNMPTALEAESPTDVVPAGYDIGVEVTITAPNPAPPTPPVCYALPSLVSPVVVYYCFVPTNVTPATWSGQSLLTIGETSSGNNRISSNLSADSANRFKVCRYTTQASNTFTGNNQLHPFNYANVDGPLTNQNFLVISSGNNSVPYSCPGEGPDPLIDSATFRHQPAS